MDRWITDTPTSVRFPIYTRGNADEVGPAPYSPLGWSLTWEQGICPGTADGWWSLGGFPGGVQLASTGDVRQLGRLFL